MPELPDIVVYVEHLRRRLIGEPLLRARVRSPNLMRTAAPPLEEAEGRRVASVSRIGKRIVLGMEAAPGGSPLHLVFHLMIAGRFRWRDAGAAVPGRVGLAAFDFPAGTLVLTEAGKEQRASLHVLAGDDALAALDPGGLEPLEATPEAFRAALRGEDHTLKRSLTSPRILSGIGNAYSDEILHRARLSPLRRASQLDDAEMDRLLAATKAVLSEWSARLLRESGNEFPGKVTAFHEAMAVHGRFGKPCPDCGAPVQRIVYGAHETNYCARCQTGGRLLADRALSRLLRKDWPRTLEEMEE